MTRIKYFQKGGGRAKNPMLEKRLLMGFIDLGTNNSTYGLPNEILLVQEALKAFIDYIEEKLLECPNIEDGICYTYYRHEDCRMLMDILFELTLEEKYRVWK